MSGELVGTDIHAPRWVYAKGACDCGCICAANDCPISDGKPNCYVCRTSGGPCPHATIRLVENACTCDHAEERHNIWEGIPWVFHCNAVACECRMTRRTK